MARKGVCIAVASVAISLGALGLSSAAGAATTTPLYLSQGAAFSILGHSCGGIREDVYGTGFAANGYPAGAAYLSTTCSTGGRGSKPVTYTGWASTVWTWYGETRSFAKLTSAPEGISTTFSAEDTYGDRIYNLGTKAYLDTTNPPVQPPAAPTGVSASVALAEEGTLEFLRMTVGWTAAPDTAGVLKSSTVTATPVNSPAPVLTTTVSSYWSSAYLQPVEPSTTYRITVTNTDSEGTSPPSTPIEIRSPNSDGEAEKEKRKVEACALNHGTIKLTPGLTETAAVQSVSVSGEFSGCEGPLGFESGKYAAHLKTTEAVACSMLSSASAEPITSSVSFSVKWLPVEEGASKGSLILPLSEASLASMTGTLSGGPFASATSIQAASVAESFTGASTCGQPTGKGKTIKPVKSGTFSTSEVGFG